MIKIAPSILSADFSNLGHDISILDGSSCEFIHIDVMDGHFVPNLTIGPMVVESLRSKTKKTFDVHLMVTNPERLIDLYIDAGADIITVHPEVLDHLHRTIQYIKSKNLKAGVALNPSTSLHLIEYVLQDLDMVLIMTVNPGFGGQKFIPAMLEKVKKLKNIITESNLEIDIEVDGGIHAGNINEIVKAGANVIVAGSAVFNSLDPAAEIQKLRNLALSDNSEVGK